MSKAWWRPAGTPQPDGGVSADLGLELSDLTDSAVEIVPQMPARVVQKIVMAYNGPMKPGVPVVIVSADAVSPDAEGQAVAYVARIVLGKPAAAELNRGETMSQPSTFPATGPATQPAS